MMLYDEIDIHCTRKPARLEENLGAVEVELTSEDLREIETAISDFTVEGLRGTGQEQYL